MEQDEDSPSGEDSSKVEIGMLLEAVNIFEKYLTFLIKFDHISGISLCLIQIEDFSQCRRRQRRSPISFKELTFVQDSPYANIYSRTSLLRTPLGLVISVLNREES